MAPTLIAICFFVFCIAGLWYVIWFVLGRPDAETRRFDRQHKRRRPSPKALYLRGVKAKTDEETMDIEELFEYLESLDPGSIRNLLAIQTTRNSEGLKKMVEQAEAAGAAEGVKFVKAAYYFTRFTELLTSWEL